MERRRYVFSGRVQGVGFRATSRHIARAFDVTGWVRNEPDGTVLMEVQGAPAEIERFLGSLGREMERFIAGHVSTMVALIEGEEEFDLRR